MQPSAGERHPLQTGSTPRQPRAARSRILGLSAVLALALIAGLGRPQASFAGSGDGGGGGAPTAGPSQPAAATCSATPANIWPADGRWVPVTVSVAGATLPPDSAGFAPLSIATAGNQSDAQGFDTAEGGITLPGALPATSYGGEVLAVPGETYVLSYQGTDNSGGAESCSATVAVQPIPAALEATDGPANAWSYGASLPTPRGELAAATGTDGRIYAIGGDVGGGPSVPPLGTVEVYDPSTDRWTTAASLRTPRKDLAATTGADGRIYAIGGDAGSGPVGTVEAYDPNSGVWTTLASLNTPRRSLAVATGTDGRIYAIGGAVSVPDPISPANPQFDASNMVEAYDPGTNSWTDVTSLPMPLLLTRLGAATGADGRIYVVAGQSCRALVVLVGAQSCGPAADLQIYDPSTNTWTAGPDRPEALEQPSVASGLDGRIYALGGGYAPSAGAPPVASAAAADAYDPGTGMWTNVVSLPEPRPAQAATTGLHGRIYLIGGEPNFLGSFGDLPTLEIYDPSRCCVVAPQPVQGPAKP